ncbi:hypothetical protein [Nonomuraea insulae]|uniref:Uncharacterized protein n=1 Tax=Nonomuraea insulae TaxID=1616787 RepID=A0ABW1CQE7_9ACTN
MKITDVVVSPVATKDPPLRNIHEVHQPYAVRSVEDIVEPLEITDGITPMCTVDPAWDPVIPRW